VKVTDAPLSPRDEATAILRCLNEALRLRGFATALAEAVSGRSLCERDSAERSALSQSDRNGEGPLVPS
jgi:hypothetical protein